MEHFGPDRGFSRFLFVLLVLAAVVSVVLIPIYGPATVSEETGPLEFVQNALLASATLTFVIAALRTNGAPRMAFTFAAMLAIVLFLRELELPPVGPVTRYLKDRSFRTHETIALAAIALPYLLLGRRHIGQLVRFGFSRTAWPFYLALVFMVVGELMDKYGGAIIGQMTARFVEEFAETCAYLVLLAYAGFAVLRGGHPAEAIPGRSASGQA